MSRQASTDAAPTMIIPRDTRIELDAHGQLSISAPGNLVLQNSGSYGSLESKSGSIRIEPGVEVEAVSVTCADACYVQGSLTAWSVKAKALQIEKTGKAYVVLQETGKLDIGRDGRLVGNFSSEKELFLLFSRFADQVRSLPFFPERGGAPQPAQVEGAAGPSIPELISAAAPSANAHPADLAEPASEPSPEAPGPPRPELAENLLFALVLLERESGRKGYGPTSHRVLEELVKLLRQRDLATLQSIHRTLFSRIVEPREDVRRAQQLIESHFEGAAP